MQIVIGSIVTSGLLAVWFINYLSPLLGAKNELALINAEIIKKQAEFQKQINLEKTHELSQTIKVINKKLVDVKSLNIQYQQKLRVKEKKLQKEKEKYFILKKNNNLKNKNMTAQVNSNISSLEAKIKTIQKKQKEAKENEKKLDEILTFNSLNGLWKSDSMIDGKNLYLEFLPKGIIRTYAGLDGKEYIFSNHKWLLEDNQLVILSQQKGKELKQIGKLKGTKIVGTEELSSGTKIVWILKRTR